MNVFYINLENRIDRKILIEDQLNQLGWTYERINAIRPNDIKDPRIAGAVGCGLSQISVLELAKERNLPYIIICEDDIKFTNMDLINEQINYILNNDIKYDVIMLAGNCYKPYRKFNDRLHRVYFAHSLLCYMVKSHYYDKLIQNYKEAIQLLRTTGNRNSYAIDVYWRKLQIEDKFLFFKEQSITQQKVSSDIGGFEWTDLNDRYMLDCEKYPKGFSD